MRAIAFLLLVGCGAQPNQPVLANAPRPNPSAVAGGAAAAAAAITLADPDAASRKPEKKQDAEKKPIKVKENVPADVLDRLEKPSATSTEPPAGTSRTTTKQPADAKTQPAAQPAGSAKPSKPPKDALDFSEP